MQGMRTIRAADLFMLDRPDTAGESNQRELVTLRPGAVVWHHGSWCAVTEVRHRGHDGVTRFTVTDSAGVWTTHKLPSGQGLTVRCDVRVDPATLAELPRTGGDVAPDMAAGVTELRAAAATLRGRETPEASATADLLTYVAERAERHGEIGGTGTVALGVARLVLGVA